MFLFSKFRLSFQKNVHFMYPSLIIDFVVFLVCFSLLMISPGLAIFFYNDLVQYVDKNVKNWLPLYIFLGWITFAIVTGLHFKIIHYSNHISIQYFIFDLQGFYGASPIKMSQHSKPYSSKRSNQKKTFMPLMHKIKAFNLKKK